MWRLLRPLGILRLNGPCLDRIEVGAARQAKKQGRQAVYDLLTVIDNSGIRYKVHTAETRFYEIGTEGVCREVV